MSLKSTLQFVCVAALGLGATSSAWADPCGMVPPIRVPVDMASTAIEREGLQTTYAFYKDGMETMVLHPGFRGKVEEFGMLIPFPSAPSIRKVSDETFTHLAAALSPPEVSVHLYEPRVRVAREMSMMPSASFGAKASASSGDSGALRIDEVKVVNQEAVGMYEVAVLAAGSPKALRGWMKDHGFRYPGEMEQTVQEYVDAKWFFTAIKARVGKKSDVEPRPGMRASSTGLPAGSSFDGHVQAMGFRFPVDEPVVPMRLSVFNGDDSHNLMYFFAEESVRVRGLDSSLVVRQVPGHQIYDHLTEPLALKVTGGSESQIHENHRNQIRAARDPGKYNGVAKALLASDLYASRTESFSLDFEEEEKELLRISESLGLRGDAIDTLHHEVSKTSASAAEEIALRDLRDMTLTVFDGNFPQAYLADYNLRFTPYEMPEERNTEVAYHRKPAGPSFSFPIQHSGSNWVPW